MTYYLGAIIIQACVGGSAQNLRGSSSSLVFFAPGIHPENSGNIAEYWGLDASNPDHVYGGAQGTLTFSESYLQAVLNQN